MTMRSNMLGTQQLLDALTDHRALYHRKVSFSTSSDSPPKSDVKIKKMVIQWFRSLTSDQRYSILTVFDRSWISIILQMQKHLMKEGPGFFFLLTDVLQDEIVNKSLPSLPHSLKSDQAAEVKEANRSKGSNKTRKKSISARSPSVNKQHGDGIALPGLCFRRARGLLARLNDDDAAGELLCRNVELFSSKESEVSCLDFLDTISISKNLLKCADEFLSMMDSITYGQFLLSFGACHDSSWEELPWLKNMGYYSLPAFIANRIELVLWSAWLRDHRAPRNVFKDLRKIGHVVKNGSNDAFASTVCRRNQGFMDWWMQQSEEVRLRTSRFAVTRAAKVEIMKVVRKLPNSFGEPDCKQRHLPNSELERKKCFSSLLAGLERIQNLMSSYLYPVLYEHLNSSQHTDYAWLFFSSLESAGTLTDRVVRRARSALQLMMVKSVEMDILKGDIHTPVLNIPSESKKKKGKKKKKKTIVSQSNSFRNSENKSLQDSIVLQQEQMEASIVFPSTGGEKCETDGKMTEKSKAGRKKSHSKVRRNNRQEYSITKNCNTEDNDHIVALEDSKLQPDVVSQMTDHRKVSTNSGVTDFRNQDACICDMLTLNDNGQRENIDLSEKHTLVQQELLSSNTAPGAISCTEGTSLSSISNLLKDSEVQSPFVKRSALSDENKQVSLQEGSSQISPGTAAVCCNSMNVGHDVLGINSEVKMSLHAKPVGFESKQGFSLVSNHPSTSPNASRSTSSQHALRERYWEGQRSHTFSSQRSTFGLHTAHEWPGTSQVRFSRGRSQIVTPATERLHLDVGRNWQQRLQASLTSLRNPIVKQQAFVMPNTKWGGNKQNNLKNSECTQLFPSGFSIAQNRGYSLGPKEDLCDFPFAQPCFPDLDLSPLTKSQEEFKHDDMTPDDTDYDECNNFSGGFDERESYLISEEESERQYRDFNGDCDGDYNQYFGGGVMFWNTADFASTGYSRPPSLSSDDSAWARHEADLSVVLDDTMGFPPAYTNIASPHIVSTSPPTTYHPALEYNPLNNSTSRVGLVLPGNDFGKFSPLSPVLSAKSEGEQAKSPHDVRNVDVDGAVPEVLTRPALRPIVVVHDRSIGRKIPGSESDKAGSPHAHHRKGEFPWQRRPPSPVLRCVPPPPPPPPPSPVSGFGKRKGLTTVRSGSSSPRRWGLLNSHRSEEQDVPFVVSEILESAWGNRGIRENTPVHPISGTLLHERFFAVTPMPLETEHPDVALPMQTTLLHKISDPSMQSALTSLHGILHSEIEGFCSQVAAENLLRKISISVAVEKVSHAMRVLWPRSRLKIFGSNATGLALPCSDVDLVVCLPPVRNLEPIKEAGILEGRNGIKETCLQHAARYLADQDWVLSDTIKTIENTAIPIIMLVAYIPNGNDTDGSRHALTSSHEVRLSEERKGPWGFHSDRQFVRLDISFESPSHTGLRTAELVRELTAQFPAIVPLALVLKQFLTVRSLDHPYTGGLSSYCLVLLITRFLQHQHHLGCPFQLNLGSLLMDFLQFFGCIFDPRKMGVSIRGGGMYIDRNQGHRIDPLHIEDPLHPSNNVGRNCFRILQCVKAFADAYSFFEKTLVEFSNGINNREGLKLLPSILSSSDSLELIVE